MRRETDKAGVTKKFPFGKITAVIGAVAGIVSIIAFSGNVLDTVDEYIVTTQELTVSVQGAEERIIAEINKEAVLTRQAILDILEIRKKKLQKQMEKLEDEGLQAQALKVLDDLKDLKKQINKIKGVE